jgi:glutaminyl-peptide cyclotransferase
MMPVGAVRIGAGLIALLIGIGCGNAENAERPALPPSFARPLGSNANAAPPAVPFDSATPRQTAEAIDSWPHDTGAYTQGLVVDNGRLLEGTGLEGQSELRLVDRTTGRVRQRVALPTTDFGEGIAVLGDTIYQLTWKGGRGYKRDRRTLSGIGTFRYDGEGWGLASDGRRLYLSDGTSRIRVLSADSLRVERTLSVKESGREVWMLNELEWVRGELWANVYQTDWIARIDPTTGRVIGWIDVGRLLTAAERADVAARGGVANGIAFDAVANRVLITGKRWPKLFVVNLASGRPNDRPRRATEASR